MNPIVKLYVKAFLVLGLVFASLMAITDYIESGSFSFLEFLFHAIFFGGAMSLTLVSIHKSNLADQGIGNPNDEDLKVVQRTEFISKVSKNEFVSRLSNDKNYVQNEIEN